ncbi:uncharacterized protein LOC119689360 isoform X2 [Teleopsis dalmanni]|uniref:uncharacterized protein LOC119689360 isoform X2 n=1 Tax=Teleopsis dalmanni TaxID=139649 RepID=UPI0018CF2970|nr:uncharacterized protein LOC119689360 isoform X2 [Teleopsis dalmanni]
MSPEQTSDKDLKYKETAKSGKDINAGMEIPHNHNIINNELNGMLLERNPLIKDDKSHVKSEDAKDTDDKEDTEASLDYELKRLNRKIDRKKLRLSELISLRKHKEELKYQLQIKNRKILMRETPEHPIITEKQESTSIKGPIGNIMDISMIEMFAIEPPTINLLNSTVSSSKESSNTQNVTNSGTNIEMEKTPALSETAEHIANQKSSEHPILLDMGLEDPSHDYEGQIFKHRGCSDKVKDGKQHNEICEAIALNDKSNFENLPNNSGTFSANRHTPESKGLAINHGGEYSYQKETDDYHSKSSQKHDYYACQVCTVQEAKYICTGCRKQWYCSTICQLIDWERHIKHCNV